MYKKNDAFSADPETVMVSLGIFNYLSLESFTLCKN